MLTHFAAPEDIRKQFWEAPGCALFTRNEIAHIRRCSVAKLDREAWLQTGIRHLKDGNRTLYRKADVVAYLDAVTCDADCVPS